MTNDPYEILGVSRNASPAEIKAAYRELVKKYHPDKYQGNPLADLAEEKLQQINEAYDALIRDGGASSGSSSAYQSESSYNTGSSADYSQIRMAVDRGDLYQAEQMLINGEYGKFISEEIKAVSEKFTNELRLWLQSIVEGIRRWLIDIGIVPRDPISIDMERKQDEYMRDRIAEIRNRSDYSQETWRNASLEERKTILRNYITELSAIYGITVPRNIDLDFRQEPHNGYITMGSYTDGLDRIRINSYVTERTNDPSDVFSTVQHELRHAYQHAACNHPSRFVVSDETIESWRDSFKNYRSTEKFMNDFGMTEEEAFAAYQAQSVEVDARSFE